MVTKNFLARFMLHTWHISSLKPQSKLVSLKYQSLPSRRLRVLQCWCQRTFLNRIFFCNYQAQQKNNPLVLLMARFLNILRLQTFFPVLCTTHSFHISEFPSVFCFNGFSPRNGTAGAMFGNTQSWPALPFFFFFFYSLLRQRSCRSNRA